MVERRRRVEGVSMDELNNLGSFKPKLNILYLGNAT
jgi:hypothetical protein